MGWWISAGAVLVMAALVTSWCAGALTRREAALRTSLEQLDRVAERAAEVMASLEQAGAAARQRRCRLVGAKPAVAPEGPHRAVRQ